MAGDCKAGERCSCGLDETQRAACALWVSDAETPEKVFGIACMAPRQKAAVQAHCFGDCGKISMAGGIDSADFGPLAVCCETACPHMQFETPEPYGHTMSFGRPHDVYLRVLKPVATQPEGIRHA